jgi:hypothetical protein
MVFDENELLTSASASLFLSYYMGEGDLISMLPEACAVARTIFCHNPTRDRYSARPAQAGV